MKYNNIVLLWRGDINWLRSTLLFKTFFIRHKANCSSWILRRLTLFHHFRTFHQIFEQMLEQNNQIFRKLRKKLNNIDVSIKVWSERQHRTVGSLLTGPHNAPQPPLVVYFRQLDFHFIKSPHHQRLFDPFCRVR